MPRRTFLTGVAAGAVACNLGEFPAGAARANRKKLERVSPESVGLSSAGILAFVDAVEKNACGLHSFMLLRHGKVAAEGWWTPYAPEHPHTLYSLSKSFTSSAIGFAVTEGRLKVDDLVTSFFPASLPAQVSENLAAMRVKHLLTMSTGHDKDATGGTVSQPEGDWVKGFLALPVEHAPGSKFVYNSTATYMLSAIVQKLTGKTVLEYLTPRLYEPLGIEGMTWENCPKGINVGGWGLNIKTEDIARFGQLYLQKGVWNGKQILPESWVTEATSKQVSNGDPAAANDWSQGYGYQFWRSRHGLYRGDGAFGQYCIVLPQHDAVFAITSGTADMAKVLNLAWEHLLPAISAQPLAASAATSELKRKTSKLILPATEGKPTSPTAKEVSGKTFRFAKNSQKIESTAFTFEGNRCVLKLHDGLLEHTIEASGGKWTKGMAPFGGNATKMAARGAWTSPDTYTLTICFYETPYVETAVCKFNGDKITLNVSLNVGFGGTQQPSLTGHA